MNHLAATAAPAPSEANMPLWIGRSFSALVILFFLLDAAIKLPPLQPVIDTMGEIGRGMDVRYRETAGGGLAATPTGRRLARERLVQIKRSE